LVAHSISHVLSCIFAYDLLRMAHKN